MLGLTKNPSMQKQTSTANKYGAPSVTESPATDDSVVSPEQSSPTESTTDRLDNRKYLWQPTVVQSSASFGVVSYTVLFDARSIIRFTNNDIVLQLKGNIEIYIAEEKLLWGSSANYQISVGHAIIKVPCMRHAVRY